MEVLYRGNGTKMLGDVIEHNPGHGIASRGAGYSPVSGIMHQLGAERKHYLPPHIS